MNTISLIGNTTREVEKRFFPKSGKAYVRFGIAVNKRYTNQTTGEVVDKPMYIDIVSYAGAETIEKYLLKGDRVGVTGELALDTWTDENGNIRSKHYIIARAVEFLKPKPKEETQPQAQTQPPRPQDYYPEEENYYEENGGILQ